MDLVVKSRRQEADGIATFELARPDGSSLPSYEAGAHVDVQLPDGLIRQYSLCGDPKAAATWRLGVLLEPNSRGGSAAMHASVREGTLLRVGEPRNLFALAPAPSHLLIAGGIGITPLLAMAYSLQASASPFVLHACFRSRSRAAFVDEVAASPFADRAVFHHDDGPADQRFDVASILAAQPPGAHLYVCGPAGLIEHVLVSARGAGWTEDRLHREHFGAVPAASGDRAFVIRLARSGRTLEVPAHLSALQALLDAGIDVPSSCEAGVCGTCLLPVLDGTPDHRDSFLTDAEREAGNCFTPCCSRSVTPTLVVDR